MAGEMIASINVSVEGNSTLETEPEPELELGNITSAGEFNGYVNRARELNEDKFNQAKEILMRLISDDVNIDEDDRDALNRLIMQKVNEEIKLVKLVSEINKYEGIFERGIRVPDGTQFETKSTWGEPGDVLKLEIDPKSHSAWTGGKQKLMDKGRISKFNKKFQNFKSEKNS